MNMSVKHQVRSRKLATTSALALGLVAAQLAMPHPPALGRSTHPAAPTAAATTQQSAQSDTEQAEVVVAPLAGNWTGSTIPGGFRAVVNNPLSTSNAKYTYQLG